jgi:hypothetical protein
VFDIFFNKLLIDSLQEGMKILVNKSDTPEMVAAMARINELETGVYEQAKASMRVRMKNPNPVETQAVPVALLQALLAQWQYVRGSIDRGEIALATNAGTSNWQDLDMAVAKLLGRGPDGEPLVETA